VALPVLAFVSNKVGDLTMKLLKELHDVVLGKLPTIIEHLEKLLSHMEKVLKHIEREEADTNKLVAGMMSEVMRIRVGSPRDCCTGNEVGS
jgi:hypothetical protein